MTKTDVILEATREALSRYSTAELIAFQQRQRNSGNDTLKSLMQGVGQVIAERNPGTRSVDVSSAREKLRR